MAKSEMRLLALVRSIFWMALLLVTVARSAVATYTGTVLSVEGNVAKVAMDGDVMPRIGARAEIFFKVAGGEDEISVATGSALKIDDGNLLVKIEESTGTVNQGQLVRFGPSTSTLTSTSTLITPAASPSLTPAIVPPPEPGRSIVGKWTGRRPADGLTATYTFKANGSVSWLIKKRGAAQRDKGKYRVDYSQTPHQIDIIDPPKTDWDGPGLHGVFEFSNNASLKMEFGQTTRASDRATKFTEAAVLFSRVPAPDQEASPTRR